MTFHYSYSKIVLFERCKRAYKLKYIDKVEEKTESEAMLRGRKIHEDIEKGIETTETSAIFQLTGVSKETEKPAIQSRQGYKGGLVRSLVYRKEENFFLEQKEVEFAFGSDFNLVPWESDRDWFHGVVDCVKCYVSSDSTTPVFLQSFKRGIEKIEVFDWKTGKSKGDRFQMEIYLLYVSLKFPEIKDVSGYFVYSDEVKKSRPILLPDPELVKTKLRIKIKKIEENKEWGCSPNFFCKFCGYREDCEGVRNEKMEMKKIESLEELLKI